MQKLKRLDTRPNRKAMDQLTEPWRPLRGCGAIFLWHYYGAATLDPVSGGTDLRSASLPHGSGASSKTGAHQLAGVQAAEVLGEPSSNTAPSRPPDTRKAGLNRRTASSSRRSSVLSSWDGSW